jgi:hypothetical protein
MTSWCGDSRVARHDEGKRRISSIESLVTVEANVDAA